MALTSGQPIPSHYPFYSSSDTLYAIEQDLGYVKAEITADADWTLPPLDLIVSGSFLCLINPSAFSVTLHAAAGEQIETAAGLAPSLLVSPSSGVQLSTQPGSWLKVAALGDVTSVSSAPGPGVSLVAVSGDDVQIKRLEAGTNISLLSGASSVTISNLLLGLTDSTVTRIGLETLAANAASDNTALGYRAAFANTSGTLNTAFGERSLYWNTDGVENTAVGSGAMGWHPDAAHPPGPFTYNSALGTHTLALMATADYNVALGTGALKGALPAAISPALNDAQSNVAAGVDCLGNVFSATFNVACGRESLMGAGTALNNVVCGYQALLCDPAFLLTNNVSNNTAHGHQALRPRVGTGLPCTFAQNCAYGAQSLGNAQPSLVGNTAAGYRALQNSRADYLTAVGWGALQNNTSGTGSVGFGYRALNTITTGTNCTGLGHDALRIATGSDNTAVGYQAGDGVITGTGNTILGADADVGSSSHSGCIILGAGATSDATNQLVLGSLANPITTVTTVGAAGGAAALPATPVVYLPIRLNGVNYRAPLYN